MQNYSFYFNIITVVKNCFQQYHKKFLSSQSKSKKAEIAQLVEQRIRNA
jgi:hypothetical protein